MTFTKRQDTVNWKSKHQTPLCGELALEEAIYFHETDNRMKECINDDLKSCQCEIPTPTGSLSTPIWRINEPGDLCRNDMGK